MEPESFLEMLFIIFQWETISVLRVLHTLNKVESIEDFRSKFRKKKFCDFFFDEPYFYPDFQKSTDFPPPGKDNCPLKNVSSVSEEKV